MMRTMLWKEYREHRIIWLAMLLVNCGTMFGIWFLDESGVFGMAQSASKLMTLGPVASLLVWGYAMICGAMLLAGEREESTLNFLDTLPLTRFHLWLVKGQIGLLLLLGQILVLCVLLAVLRSTESPTVLNENDISQSFWPYVLGMMFSGAIGMAYAFFFSARGEYVLNVLGMTIIGQAVAWLVAFFLAFAAVISLHVSLSWIIGSQNGGIPFEVPYLAVLAFGGLTVAVVVGSARVFSNTDQQRRQVGVRRIRSRASLVVGCLRLLWLCDRQMRRLALGVLAFSLGLGVLFLVAGPLLWPVVTLLLGIVCGVNVFSDEQTNGSFRFLGEQGLPLGRLWLFKTGTRFALLLLASFLVLLPSFLVALYHSSEHGSNGRRELFIVVETLHSNLMVEVVPLGSYLLLPLLYGFSSGQLCGLLSRKSIVAGMIALMASAGLAVVWLPSLAGIGLHLWQIAVPPLILLVASALLMRAWVADRLASWRTYLSVSAALAASLLWIVIGLWYRVGEVPNVPEPFDVAAYKASLPKLEDDKAGQLIRGVSSHVESTIRTMHSPRDNMQPLNSELYKVLNEGWPEGNSDLGEWLDKTFAEDWVKELSPLPELPTGMVANPSLLTKHSREHHRWDWALNFSAILLARGWQQQGRGDPSVFVDHLGIGLALSRNFQHHMSSSNSIGGEFAATLWQSAVDLWLKRLKGRPDLLKRALQILIDHEAKLPDGNEPEKVDYLIDLNTLTERPEEILAMAIPISPKSTQEFRDTELQLTALFWRFPWEQARHQRILRVEYRGTEPEKRRIGEWGGTAFQNLGSLARLQRRRDRLLRSLAELRAGQLKVALRLYQEENGSLPDTLDTLVPRFLQSVPHDPFVQGRRFQYRRSHGDLLIWSDSNQPNQIGGMDDIPAEMRVMPRADEQAQPANQDMPAVPMGVAGMFGLIDQGPLPEEVPFMPGADHPGHQPPVRRMPRRNVGGAAGGGPVATRRIPQGQGILWSAGEDGQDDGGKEQGINNQSTPPGTDLIYLVPPPP
jgi:hypothetical protein